MRLTVLLSLLLVLNVNWAYGHRESTYYLYGFFGETEVGIHIDDFGHTCTAYYFTFDDRFDRILEGTISDNHNFELFAFHWDKKEKQKTKGASLLLKEVKRDIWEGTWNYEDGTTEAVHLKPINIDSLNHPYAATFKEHALSPYTAYKLRDIQFKKGKKELISKGYQIQHILDPESQIEWFRLIGNTNSISNVDQINDKLTADHLNQINLKYSSVKMGESGEYKVKYKIHFLNSHLISYTVSSNTWYNHKKGKDFTYHLTLSLSAAKALTLEDIVWFGDTPKPEISKGEYEWFQYRYKVFGPKVLELEKTLYPRKFSAKKRKCNYDDVKLWQFPHWHLTEKGLYLGSKSSITNRKCDAPGWSVIPYEQLSKYLSEDYIFSLLNTEIMRVEKK